MRMETFIRKQLKMKAHWVPKVEETPEGVVVWIDRLGQRPLRCGRCNLPVRQVHSRGPRRRWCHLALGETPCWLVYRPFRVRCPACGVRVERTPWADLWQRVTHSTAWAEAHLRQWLWRAAHSRLEPFKKLARMLRTHLDGGAGLDRDPRHEPRPGRDEQQGQGDQPSGLRLSPVLDLHRQHLPGRPPPLRATPRPGLRDLRA